MLEDLFLLLQTPDHTAYRTGQVIDCWGDFRLVRFDTLDESVDPPLELFMLEELSDVCDNCGAKLALFFKEREQMVRYIEWLQQPDPEPKGNVVPLRKSHEPKPL